MSKGRVKLDGNQLMFLIEYLYFIIKDIDDELLEKV